MNSTASPSRVIPCRTHGIWTSERRWVLKYALLIMALTTVPYLIGYACQGDQWRFTGFVFGVEDGNSYIAKMLSGAYGAWLFRTPYTTIEQRGVIAFLPYLLLGKLSSPPGIHEQLVAIFHLFRFVCGVLAILATYEFLAIFLKRESLRRLGVVLATIGGGLGWLLLFLGHSEWLGSLPLDFYSPETFGFLALYGLPHLSLARAALLWGLGIYLSAVKQVAGDQPTDGCSSLLGVGVKLGAWWLLAALAQPLTALVMGVVPALHLLSLAIWEAVGRRGEAQPDWKKWGNLLKSVCVAGVIVTPFLLYNAVAFSTDPFLKAWTEQNIITSPHPSHYILAYGLFLPLAVWGGWHLVRQSPWEGWLVVTWALALPVLVYMPINLQRRLSEGGWVAIVLLAMKGLDELSAGRRRQPVWIKHTLLAFSLPSTVVLLGGGILTAHQPSQPAFRPRGEVEAFEFLGQYAHTGDVVVGSFETGNALPAWAPLRVVIGHGPESSGLSALQARVEAFYQSESDDEMRQKFIREQNIRYVFWGPEERSLGNWNPGSAGYLKRVYHNGTYEVFEVSYPATEQ